MADTTNYGWTKPTEGGSSGAWDTILNTAIDDIDTDLQGVEDKADDALAVSPVISTPVCAVVCHLTTGGYNNADDDVAGRGAESGLHLPAAVGNISRTYFVPLPHLAEGMRITGFKSRGQAPTGTTVTALLLHFGAAGWGSAGVGLTHTATLATLTESLSTAVAAATSYYVRIDISRSSGSMVPAHHWVQVTTERI